MRVLLEMLPLGTWLVLALKEALQTLPQTQRRPARSSASLAQQELPCT